MPRAKPTSGALPSPELVLAAIERAERHNRGRKRGVSREAIKEHLGLARGSSTTRQLRPIWDALVLDGLVEEVRRQGLVLWALTDEGHAQLADRGEVGTLPESPQHRRWREARRAACGRIDELQDELRLVLHEASELLDRRDQGSSGTWYDIGQRLQRACRIVASATYCLSEWAEPDDVQADIDEPPYGHGARRETHGWDRP
jgi:DNA-binding PadR family transcriptional regulator